MFSDDSRYKNVSNNITMDTGGRLLESKSIRPLPEVTGTFRHTLEDRERFDHLAFKYYRQSGRWWRICDANPQFKSPLALLGEEPVVQTLFPVTYTSPENASAAEGNPAPPPWYKVIAQLTKIPGIIDVSIQAPARLGKKTTEILGKKIEHTVEEREHQVIVTYNRLKITPDAVTRFIESSAEGFSTAAPITTGRVGKIIIIPPDA